MQNTFSILLHAVIMLIWVFDMTVRMCTQMKTIFIRKYHFVWVNVVPQDPIAKPQTLILVVFGLFLVAVQFVRIYLPLIL